MRERDTGENPFGLRFQADLEASLLKMEAFRDDVETMSGALREGIVTDAEFFQRLTTGHEPGTGIIVYIDEEVYSANGGPDGYFLDHLSIQVTPDRKLKVDNRGTIIGTIGLSKKGKLVAREVTDNEWNAHLMFRGGGLGPNLKAWGRAMITALKSVRPLQ